MNTYIPFFRWAEARPFTDVDAIRIFSLLNNMTRDLTERINSFKLEPEYSSQIESFVSTVEQTLTLQGSRYDPFALTSTQINFFEGTVKRFQSAYFGFLVSAFFQGKKFWYEQNVLNFYKGPVLTRKGTVSRRIHDDEHEIDIIIRKMDGRDLWIEVKNNNFDWSLEEYAQ